MSVIFPGLNKLISCVPTGYSVSGGSVFLLNQRLPTDPLFFSSLTMQNVVSGSRYRVTRNSTGDELATGIAGGAGITDVEIAAIPVFSNPMQVNITVRNASDTPQYRIFDTQASIARTGAVAFILQQQE